MELLRATPESKGIASGAIEKFIDVVREKKIEIHSFMMQRDGAVVFEEWWKPHGKDIPHNLYSVSKSFTSMAVGFTVQEGLLTVEDYVTSFFKDSDNPSQNLKKMKVKHLLSMNTGHTQNTMEKMFQSHDWVMTFLKQDVPKEPGTHFLYNDGASYMLSAIVQGLTGKNINDYLEQKLYSKIGIKHPTWEECPKGIAVGETGLAVTTEEILRFTMFLQNKGMWNGEQIVDSSWIETATTVHSKTAPNDWDDWEQGYGYQFWWCRHGAYMANGAFGQMGIVLDDKDTTIAITSHTTECQLLLDCVWEILLPALGDVPLP